LPFTFPFCVVSLELDGFSSPEHMFVRDSLSVNSNHTFKTAKKSPCGVPVWCWESPPDANLFGNYSSKVNEEANKGVMYSYFGGRSMSFKKLDLLIRPIGESQHSLRS